MMKHVTLPVVIIAVMASCSIFNREGPHVTCADLDGGLRNACKNGIIASCSDGATVTATVCDDSTTCDNNWQTTGAYRCSQSDPIYCAKSKAVCGGACVDPQVDTENCGTCGTACPGGYACQAGACTCTSGTDCNGTCANLSTDTANCGTCGKQCHDGLVCVAGKCLCPNARTECGARCVDLSADPTNCGSCNTQCPQDSSCKAAKCSCDSSGMTLCGSACTALDFDPTNCGACGKSCSYQTACLYKICPQAPPNTTCGTASPVTVSTAKNEVVIGTLLGVPKTSSCSNGFSTISGTQEVFYEITTASAGVLTAKVEAFLAQSGGNSATTVFGPSIEFRMGTCTSGTKTTCTQVTGTTTVNGPTTLWVGVIAAHNGGTDGAFALTLSLN